MSNSKSFSGFPKEGLKFLGGLALNNDREWFNTHKQDYIDFVRTPAQAFVGIFGERLQALSEGISYDARANGGSIMRIYRDIRFSKDKRPYNARLRMIFWEGTGKKTNQPSFFIWIDAKSAGIYSGIHVFPKELLERFRKAVDDDILGAELETAINSVKQTGEYRVGGEHYKRMPRGYDSDHPRANLLRYNGLYVISPKIELTTVLDSSFVDVCIEHCSKMILLHHWLVKINQLGQET